MPFTQIPGCCWPTKAFVYETGENVNAPMSWPWVSLHQNPPKSDHVHGAVTWSVWEDRCTERASHWNSL